MKRIVILCTLLSAIVGGVKAQEVERLKFGPVMTGATWSGLTCKFPAGTTVFFQSWGRVGVTFDPTIDLSGYKTVGVEFTTAPTASGNDQLQLCWTDGTVSGDQTQQTQYGGTSTKIVPVENQTSYTFSRPANGWGKGNCESLNIKEFGIFYNNGEGETSVKIAKLFLVKDDDTQEEYATEFTTLNNAYHVSAHLYEGEVSFVGWGNMELFNENFEGLSHQSTDGEECTYNITFSEATPMNTRLRFQYYNDTESKWADIITYSVAASSTSFSQTVPTSTFSEHNCKRVVFGNSSDDAGTVKISSITRGGREMVTVGSTGYTTYTTAKQLEFSRVEGTKTYVVTARNSETGALTLKQVDVAPVGTPVVICVENMDGESSKTFGIPSTSKSADSFTNILQSSTGFEVTADGYTYYALANKTSHGVAFYKVAVGKTIPSGKAYMKIATASGAREYYGFDFSGDETTDISLSATTTTDATATEGIYTLNGQRVAQPIAKGIYIVNGKKVVIR